MANPYIRRLVEEQLKGEALDQDDNAQQAFNQTLDPTQLAQDDPAAVKGDERLEVTDQRAQQKTSNDLLRAQELKDLMGRWEAAQRKSANRSAMAGGFAAQMAGRDPAAGAAMERGLKPWTTAPVDEITGGQQAGARKQDLDLGTYNQARLDDENDPGSEVSKMYREAAKRYGIPLPENVPATAIKPIIGDLRAQREIERKEWDTGVKEEGKNLRQAESDRARMARVEKQERNKNYRAEVMFDKGVVASGFAQQSRFGVGGRGGMSGRAAVSALKLSGFQTVNAPPFMEAKGGGAFFVARPGRLLDRDARKAADDLGVAVTNAEDQFTDMMSMLEGMERNPTIFEENYPRLVNAMENVYQEYTKLKDNGVLNEGDLESAQRAFGEIGAIQSYKAFVDFMRGGIKQRLGAQVEDIYRGYPKVMATIGYIQSDKPHPDTKTLSSLGDVGGGGGGGKSGSAPVTPADKAVKKALKRRGLGDEGETTEPRAVIRPNDPGEGKRVAGTIYNTPKGPAKWTGTGWIRGKMKGTR